MNGRFMLAVIHLPDEQELPFSFVSWNLRTSIPQLETVRVPEHVIYFKNNSEMRVLPHS